MVLKQISNSVFEIILSISLSISIPKYITILHLKKILLVRVIQEAPYFKVFKIRSAFDAFKQALNSLFIICFYSQSVVYPKYNSNRPQNIV